MNNNAPLCQVKNVQLLIKWSAVEEGEADLQVALDHLVGAEVDLALVHLVVEVDLDLQEVMVDQVDIQEKAQDPDMGQGNGKDGQQTHQEEARVDIQEVPEVEVVTVVVALDSADQGLDMVVEVLALVAAVEEDLEDLVVALVEVVLAKVPPVEVAEGADLFLASNVEQYRNSNVNLFQGSSVDLSASSNVLQCQDNNVAVCQDNNVEMCHDSSVGLFQDSNVGSNVNLLLGVKFVARSFLNRISFTCLQSLMSFKLLFS